MTQRNAAASGAAAAPAASCCSSSAASSPCVRDRWRSASPPGCSTSPPRRPPLAACKPIDKGGNSIVYAADGSRLGVVASDEARTPVAIQRDPEGPPARDGRDRGRALLRARRHRPRGRSSAPRSRTSKPASRSRAARRSPSSWCATSASPTPSATSNARSSRRSWRSSTTNATPSRKSSASTSTPPPTGRSKGSTAVGVQAASKIYFSKPVWKLTWRRRRCSPACRRRRPNTTRSSTRRRARTPQRGAGEDGRPRLHLRRRGPGRRAAGARPRRLRRATSTHRQPYFFDYVEDKLIEALRRRRRCASGGLQVHTTIDPRLQEVGAGSDALGAALLERPLLGAGLDRPAQRPYRGDGLQLQLRRQPVQPRRPGPPPARLDLQDLRADDGDQAGDRPLLDLLHLQTARPQPARMGPLGSPHRRRGLPGQGQPAAGDGRLRQHRLRPARPRRRARERRRDGEVDGDRHARSTASRPRESAACGSASRRWRWPTPTRPSPRAASTATRSRSSASSSPAGTSTAPSTPSRGGSSPKRSPTR